MTELAFSIMNGLTILLAVAVIGLGPIYGLMLIADGQRKEDRGRDWSLIAAGCGLLAIVALLAFNWDTILVLWK